MVPTAQTNLFCHRQTDITKHGQCTLNQKVINSTLCIVLVYFLLIFRCSIVIKILNCLCYDIWCDMVIFEESKLSFIVVDW